MWSSRRPEPLFFSTVSLRRLQFPAPQSVVEVERQDGQALPNLADARQTAEHAAGAKKRSVSPKQVANCGQLAIGDRHTKMIDGPINVFERYAAWTTAGIMLHYERLLEESCQEPLRWELRRAGCAMSKAIKAYASADFRARREQHNLVVRQRFDQLAKECAQEAPEEEIEQNALRTSPYRGCQHLVYNL